VNNAEATGHAVPWTLALAGVLAAAVLSSSTGVSTGATPASPPPALTARPLQTALMDDPSVFEAPSAELAMGRTRAAGATAIRLLLRWSSIAPTGVRPVGFDPADPADPGYRWQAFDRQVVLATLQGLTPIVSVDTAPAWAGGSGQGAPGSIQPDPEELGLFARAAATRYSGTVAGLPRVRYWQVWSEPNLYLPLEPQFRPIWYRRMLNSAAAAIRSVHRDNVVIAGGLAPFTPRGADPRVAPLNFMREMLCLSRKLRRTCRDRSYFDVWAHHPYTSGGPTHHAYGRDDVSLGDLPEMRRTLIAAHRNGSIASKTRPKFWVTEFSWDTKPPDPRGVPASLHARWVAEALYRMWQSGVSLVTWFLLKDRPVGTSFFQSGLYYSGASFADPRPKPALQAFRFPFVGFPRRGGVFVWGRTPAGRRGRVIVEQSFRGRWRRLGVLRTNRYGIFEHRFASKPLGSVRARSLSTMEYARPFSLKHHPDRFFNPFGLPTLLEPRRKGRP
jgi:hypothetical protein